LELDRHYIERNDFAAARRGYDPDEVDRHLRELADAVTELKRQQKPSPASLASAAADQVRSIVEAAEQSAAEIQQNAENEARRITDDASAAARQTRERADADAVQRVREAEEATTRVLEHSGGIESEVDRLLSELRASANGLVERLNGAAGSLQTELDQLRTEFAGVREARLEPGGDAGPVDAEPEVVEEVEAEVAAVDVEDEVLDEEEPEVEEELATAVDGDGGGDFDTAVEEVDEVEAAEPEPEPEPASSGRSIRGAEGARLIALNMALNGTPRDETARYLEQNFDLDDQDALLDEVYARVGG
jgi:DivIVA domain-containing protein